MCWSDAKAGMGLRFTRVDAVDQAAIDDFVDAHFTDEKSRAEAGTPPGPPPRRHRVTPTHSVES